MATFPSGLYSHTTLYDNTDDVLAAHPNTLGGEIAAIEAKIGVNGSAIGTSIDYKLTHLPTQEQDLDIGAYELRAKTLESAVATGTAPMTIASTTKVTNLNADTLDDLEASVFVRDTGDETIAGVKTFSSFPITPSSTPTTNYQVANKKYVDDSVPSASLITVQQANGTTDITSTTSFADMTDMTLSVVVATGDTVIIDFNCAIGNSSGGDIATFQLLRDASVLQTSNGNYTQGGTWEGTDGLHYVDTPAAATYTYKVQWKSINGTSTNGVATDSKYRNLRVIKIHVV